MRESNAGATTVRLVLPSDLRVMDLVHSATEQMAELAGFDAEDALNVALAMREAVINAILHGNKRDARRRVRVALTAGPKGFRASVVDQGEGFDANHAPDPTADDNRLRTSGRGILLMRAFVDTVEFRHRPGSGTEVTLRKNRPMGKDERRADAGPRGNRN